MGRQHEFPSTHWSLVAMASADDDATRRQGLTHFLTRYLPAMRSYLEGPLRLDPADADDLLQSFVADKVIGRELLTHVVAQRGRLRAYLKASLHNYVRSRFHAATGRGKEKQFPCEAAGAELAALRQEPYDVFEVAWAREVLREALRRMETHCRSIKREDVWIAFAGRVLNPTVLQEPSVPCGELMAQLRLKSEAEASNLVVTAKRMFSRMLKDVVGEYIDSEGGIQDELRELRAIVSSAGNIAMIPSSGA